MKKVEIKRTATFFEGYLNLYFQMVGVKIDDDVLFLLGIKDGILKEEEIDEIREDLIKRLEAQGFVRVFGKRYKFLYKLELNLPEKELKREIKRATRIFIKETKRFLNLLCQKAEEKEKKIENWLWKEAKFSIKTKC